MAKDDPLSHTSSDIADPLRYEGNFSPVKSNGVRIPFERITPLELVVLRDLGRRVTLILVQMREVGGVHLMPPHEAISSADFAVAHLQFGLDLPRLREATNDDLLREYLEIARHIDRRIGVIGDGARLRFVKT